MRHYPKIYLAADVLALDIDEYLPNATMEWCRLKLVDIGFNQGRVSPTTFVQGSQKREHELAYVKLRREVQIHIDSGLIPDLEETLAPYGGRAWQPSEETIAVYNRLHDDPHGPEARELELPDDGPDIEARADDFVDEDEGVADLDIE